MYLADTASHDIVISGKLWLTNKGSMPVQRHIWSFLYSLIGKWNDLLSASGMQVIFVSTNILKSVTHFWNLRQSHWYSRSINNVSPVTCKNSNWHSGAKSSGVINLNGLLLIFNSTRFGITSSNRGNTCSLFKLILSTVNDVSEEIFSTGEAGSFLNKDGFLSMYNRWSDVGRFFGISPRTLRLRSIICRLDKW